MVQRGKEEQKSWKTGFQPALSICPRPTGSLLQIFSDNLFCQISNGRQLLFQAELVATHERLYYYPKYCVPPCGRNMHLH